MHGHRGFPPGSRTRAPRIERIDGVDMWVIDGRPTLGPGLVTMAGYDGPAAHGVPAHLRGVSPGGHGRGRAHQAHGRGRDLGRDPLPERRRLRLPVLPGDEGPRAHARLRAGLQRLHHRLDELLSGAAAAGHGASFLGRGCQRRGGSSAASAWGTSRSSFPASPRTSASLRWRIGTGTRSGPSPRRPGFPSASTSEARSGSAAPMATRSSTRPRWASTPTSRGSRALAFHRQRARHQRDHLRRRVPPVPRARLRLGRERRQLDPGPPRVPRLAVGETSASIASIRSSTCCRASTSAGRSTPASGSSARCSRTAIERYPDNILYETDFPHPTSMSPGPATPAVPPRQYAADVLGKLPREVVGKLLHDQRRTGLSHRLSAGSLRRETVTHDGVPGSSMSPSGAGRRVGKALVALALALAIVVLLLPRGPRDPMNADEPQGVDRASRCEPRARSSSPVRPRPHGPCATCSTVAATRSTPRSPACSR